MWHVIYLKKCYSLVVVVYWENLGNLYLLKSTFPIYLLFYHTINVIYCNKCLIVLFVKKNMIDLKY